MLSAIPYLEHRSQALWDQVRTFFSIKISYHQEKNYGYYKINDCVSMYVPDMLPCKDSFAHELLHLWMDMQDVSVSCTLSATFKTDRLLTLLFKPELGDHLGNCADHYKMLPLYLDMGFERNKFIDDYDSIKCSETEISMIEDWYYHTDFRSRQYAVEQYLAKYFAIKACPNPRFDYNEPLQRLKALDSELHAILEEFWIALQDFDMGKADVVFNSYRQFSYPFTEDLKKHVAEKFST